MKVLITGAAGMLGADVSSVLRAQGYSIIATDINQRMPEIVNMDITNSKEVFSLIEKNMPDYVFHLAAETNVDLCEENPEHAFRVNVLGTENVARACKTNGVKLLYVSTAAVFAGDKHDPYIEFDEPRALNVYGKSKLQGEIIVEKLLTEYFIIRAGWMVGGWNIDKKFVYKIVQQLKSGKREIAAVNDKLGSPTFTKDFAVNLMLIINSGRYGLYHLVNKGTCSRYEIALKIVEFMRLKDKVMVKPVSSALFPLPAPRGYSEMLQNYKLELLGINNMPHWQDALAEYIMLNKDREMCNEKS